MRPCADLCCPPAAQFASFLLQVGEGRLPVCPGTDDFVRLPASIAAPQGSTLDAMVADVFPGLAQRRAGADDSGEYFGERAILTTRNEGVDAINEACIGAFCPDVPATVLLSADDVAEVGDASLYQPEFLNSLNISGLPPHRLALKAGCPIMLLRNMRGMPGMVNGARLIVRRIISRFVLEAVIAVGDFKGEVVYIPRMKMSPSDGVLPFKVSRLQFPVRPAFAISINKSQGQTLERIAVYLPQPVFSHGHLYVALSRVGAPDRVSVMVPASDNNARGHLDLQCLPAVHRPACPPGSVLTRNVVYGEALSTVTMASS